MLKESACFKNLANLHFTDVSFKAALKYLHQAKLIFYFKKRGLIVADMQVILNKQSEIVHYNIELVTGSNVPAALDSMWMKFCRHGILHVKCLDKFPSHFKKGSFSREDLLDRFSDLHTLYHSWVLRSSDAVSPASGGESVLSRRPQDTGSACHGHRVSKWWAYTFCRLVCHLINAEKWCL